MDDAEANDIANDRTPPEVSLKDLLEKTEPGTWVIVRNMFYYSAQLGHPTLMAPEINAFCNSESCKGTRIFRNSIGKNLFHPEKATDFVLGYRCKNCGQHEHKFAIEFHLMEGSTAVVMACKFGQNPPFGPRVSPQVNRLFQPDRELLLKGRRSESQGLGIGAFAYYRRIVESNKDRLFDQVIKVAQKEKAPAEIIERLEAAKNEIQFKKAMEDAKDIVPESLRIDGQNPFTILHTALSRGIHGSSDEECLELAHAVRLVLSEFAERVASVLREHAELSAALSKLTNPQQPAS